jgi:hypothetical protein
LVFLIGCDHCKAQTYAEDTGLDDPQNKTQREFREVLIKAIKYYDPDLIAEESHSDLLKEAKRRSVALEVASESRICHIFCEPSYSEKLKLGIGYDLTILGNNIFDEWGLKITTTKAAHQHDIGHRWPIREEFWIKQLERNVHKKVLFICGAAHRWTLRRRLESTGIEVIIVRNAKRFGAARMENSHFDAYKDVRRNGFDPETGCFCIKFPPQIPLNF